MSTEIENIIKTSHESNFMSSFIFLPKVKREAMNTVYSFCRFTDDIADSDSISHDRKMHLLKKWREEFEKALKSESDYQILNKVGKVINGFNIPVDPFFDLIRGMEMDLEKKEYLTIQDLLEYCYNVASTVGLMTIEIFGYKSKNTKDFAINLGIALQLTNILRDLKEDAINNKFYIPSEDLNLFQYSAGDMKSNLYNQNFKRLMNYEFERANFYYEKANSYLDDIDRKNLFAARIMQHIYYRLLLKIKEKNFDVFSHRIKMSNLEKIYISSGVWLKYNLIYR